MKNTDLQICCILAPNRAPGLAVGTLRRVTSEGTNLIQILKDVFPKVRVR